jgi:hypothetical protein
VTRAEIERYVRWMQEIRRFKPSTVARRMAVVSGFDRTWFIDGVLEHSPARAGRSTAPPPTASVCWNAPGVSPHGGQGPQFGYLPVAYSEDLQHGRWLLAGDAVHGCANGDGVSLDDHVLDNDAGVGDRLMEPLPRPGDTARPVGSRGWL